MKMQDDVFGSDPQDFDIWGGEESCSNDDNFGDFAPVKAEQSHSDDATQATAPTVQSDFSSSDPFLSPVLKKAPSFRLKRDASAAANMTSCPSMLDQHLAKQPGGTATTNRPNVGNKDSSSLSKLSPKKDGTVTAKRSPPNRSVTRSLSMEIGKPKRPVPPPSVTPKTAGRPSSRKQLMLKSQQRSKSSRDLVGSKTDEHRRRSTQPKRGTSPKGTGGSNSSRSKKPQQQPQARPQLSRRSKSSRNLVSEKAKSSRRMMDVDDNDVNMKQIQQQQRPRSLRRIQSKSSSSSNKVKSTKKPSSMRNLGNNTMINNTHPSKLMRMNSMDRLYHHQDHESSLTAQSREMLVKVQLQQLQETTKYVYRKSHSSRHLRSYDDDDEADDIQNSDHMISM